MLVNCKVTELNGNGSMNKPSMNNYIMNDCDCFFKPITYSQKIQYF